MTTQPRTERERAYRMALASLVARFDELIRTGSLGAGIQFESEIGAARVLLLANPVDDGDA